ncbi:hypothetical protein [Streptomyces sp. NPDC086023]|uniref:hypothetical protein n=1 Tax=Streptomyces sp. NPDC086023 TaxID=3365746 RepID=UPI0037CF5E6A
MATSGKRIAALCAIAALTIGACAPGVSGSKGGEKRRTGRTTHAFCKVGTPDAWKKHRARTTYKTPPSPRAYEGVVSPDGKKIFAEESTDRLTRVVLRTPGGGRKVIDQMPQTRSKKLQQFVLWDFDGRWLVYQVSYDAENMNDWAIYAWDSETGEKPFRITRNTANGPFLFLRAQGGKAAWTQGGGGAGRKQVHVYDLRSRHDQVVRTGMVSPVTVSGDLVVWREAFSATAPVKVQAASLTTGRGAKLPEQLAKIKGTTFVTGSSDGSTWAWTSPDMRKLYAWQKGWKTSALVATLGEGQFFDQMEIAGNLITWQDESGLWAADLRSHSMTRLNQDGVPHANGDKLLVSYQTGGFSKDPADYQGTTAYVLTASRLAPLPSCLGWVPLEQPPTETAAPDAPADPAAL